METSFLKFIRDGQIGDFQIGMTRAEVRSKMGNPQDWTGKPPVFGQQILSPEESPGWFYYGDAVGIGFEGLEETSISNGIGLTPEKIDKTIEPFLDWPIGSEAIMGQLKEYLIKTDIPWQEYLEEDYYSIIINDHCYTFSPICTEAGEVIPPLDRKIDLMNFVADRKRLPTEWKPRSKYIKGIPIPDRPGFIRSPFHPEKLSIDAKGKTSGELMTCPYTGKIFIVP